MTNLTKQNNSFKKLVERLYIHLWKINGQKCNINECSIACRLIPCIFGHDYGIMELLHFLQLCASACNQTSNQ